MAQPQSIRIKNLAAVQRAIINAGVPAKEVGLAGYEAGQIVLNTVRRPGYAPVRTGKLIRSFRVLKQSTKIVIRGGGSRVPYANPIHWGWFYDKDNFVYKNIKPNQFLVRALGHDYKEVYETYIRNIDKLLKHVSDAAVLKRRAGL